MPPIFKIPVAPCVKFPVPERAVVAVIILLFVTVTVVIVSNVTTVNGDEMVRVPVIVTLEIVDIVEPLNVLVVPENV